MVTVSVDDSSL